MMKKALFLLIFIPLASASFAQVKSNRYLYVEGSASRKGHYEFFLTNFKKEASGAGFIVTEKSSNAAHTLKFIVSPRIILDNGSRALPETNLEEDQHIIKISLIRNSDNFEILTFDFFFTDLDEVYDHTKTLFHQATLYIQPGSGSTSIAKDIVITDKTTGEEIIIDDASSQLWKNKWIYLRASFDYPLTFYLLQGTGLIGGIGLYEGTFDEPNRVSPIDHEVMAMPGATVGIEFQFLNFMSAEVNYQFSMGDTRSNYFVNMAISAELKFPIKFSFISFAPYVSFFYPITISDIFSSYPPFMYGGGIQFCAKGGKRGAFFFDVKFLLSYGETLMHNPYLAYPEEQWLYPEPSVIHYKRYYLGLGAGYKIGFLDRKKRVRETQ